MTSQQLKNSILQMAVQGKLVPQNPDDEPASVLLERIKAEKEELIKQKKIKKEKPFVPITEDEIPFEIPESWEWSRLGEIFNIIMGQSPKGEKVFEGNEGIEFHQGKVFFGNQFLNVSNQVTTEPTKIAPVNSVLLCVRAPVGKVNITEREICIGRGLSAIVSLADMDSKFVFYLLETYENVFVKQATGTTFVAITGEIVKNQVVPLPPLSEQKRIVAKIEELLPYIEAYEKAETQLKDLNISFPEMLKKSILQEAVQGKLVPQNPDDEPASVLLERIKAEKQELIRQGKIKKEKPSAPISEDEIPFEIPESWEWCRLNDIFWVTKLAGFEYTKYFIKENVSMDNDVHIVRARNVKMNQYIENEKEAISKELSILLNRSALTKNCILMTFIGAGVGDVCIYDKKERHHLAPNVAKIEPFSNLLSLEYILFGLMSPLGQNNVSEIKKAVAQPSLSMETIRGLLIPFPPFAEQKRIVAKIEELMPMIESLS